MWREVNKNTFINATVYIGKRFMCFVRISTGICMQNKKHTNTLNKLDARDAHNLWSEGKKMKPLLPQLSFFKIISCSQILAWTRKLSALFLQEKLNLNGSARQGDLSAGFFLLHGCLQEIERTWPLVDGAGMERGRRLPCDPRGRAALHGAGEHDGHVLPDGVGPQRDVEVWGLLIETLQVLDVCGRLPLHLKSRGGKGSQAKTRLKWTWSLLFGWGW